MNQNITSKQFAAIKTKAFDIVSIIREAQLKLNQLGTSMADCGLEVKRNDNETELAWLGRVAASAAEREHDLIRKEALDEVNRRIEGEVMTSGPRTWMGRKLNSLAQIVG